MPPFPKNVLFFEIRTKLFTFLILLKFAQSITEIQKMCVELMHIYTHKNMCGKSWKLIKLKTWREKKCGGKIKTETLFFKPCRALVIRWLTVSHKPQKEILGQNLADRKLFSRRSILRIIVKLPRGGISPRNHQQVNTGTNEWKPHVRLTNFIRNYNIFLQQLSTLKELWK